MDETPYRLAYDASVRAIEDQARVLEDLRSLMYDGNAPRIRALLIVFQLGILFLSIEVAAWTVALWRL